MAESTEPEKNQKEPHALRNGGNSGRGGRRPGAGRKPDYLKRLGITPMNAAQILAHYDEKKLWDALIYNKSHDIRLRALSYLSDKRDGKAKVAVDMDVKGGLVHAHPVYRDPKLASLSSEELQALDSITKKLATGPVSLLPLLSDGEQPCQNAPVNQTKSDACTNGVTGEVVDILGAETVLEASIEDSV
jgi:hypothetical protein